MKIVAINGSPRGMAGTTGRLFREQRHFPEQDKCRRGFKARMAYLVDMTGEDWPYERDYLASRQSFAG